MNRRKFITGTVAGGGLALANPSSIFALATSQAIPYSRLGRTEAEVSKLGIGCAPFRRSHVTPNDVGNMIHTALEMGINYFDVAPNYGDAEEKMGPTVKDVRDKMFLVSKTESPTYKGTWDLLKQSMRRLKTDYLDLVHIHNLGLESRFPDLDLTFGKEGALGALMEAQQQGVIRFIGASGHLFPSRFHKALDTGKIDVLMNAVNFIVRHTYDFENKVWARARLEDIGLVGMKILGGQKDGKDFRIPENYYDEAIRYAFNLPGLATAVIGIENMAELQKLLETTRKISGSVVNNDFQLTMDGLQMSQKPEWQKAYGSPEL